MMFNFWEVLEESALARLPTGKKDYVVNGEKRVGTERSAGVFEAVLWKSRTVYNFFINSGL